MAEIVTGTIHDFDPKTNKWIFRCGHCAATDNPPVAIVGRKQSKAVCRHCGR